MAVSERTRKILWVEAGGRCAICRRQVLTRGSEADDPSVFGEEAHIVGQGPRGPRAGALNADLIDRHENLLLLCSEHHKQVDDQVNEYTVERLCQIKRDHKEWISSLGSPEPAPVRLVPDPSFARPHNLKLITTGNVLWNMIQECKAFEYTLADHLPAEDEDLIIEFLDHVKDYMEIAGDLYSVREQRDAERAIGGYVSQLAKRDFLVGALLRHMLLTGGIQEDPWPWAILRVEVQPGSLAKVVDTDGKPVSLLFHGGWAEPKK